MEDFFVAHLGDIKAAVAFVAGRHRLSADEREELAALTYLKLMDRDYAILRQFAGRSSLRTYLTTVVQRLFLDYRISRWGKWRPSKAARSRGAAGVLLERLLVRQGLSFDQACSVIRATHGPEACDGLASLADRCPPRSRRHHVEATALEGTACSAPGADRLVTAAERRRMLVRAAKALAGALAGLRPDDRLILQLRFVENLKICDIARRLQLTQEGESKALYARIRRQLAVLAAALEQAGIDRAEVLDAISAPDAPVVPVFTLANRHAMSAPSMGGQMLVG